MVSGHQICGVQIFPREMTLTTVASIVWSFQQLPDVRFIPTWEPPGLKRIFPLARPFAQQGINVINSKILNILQTISCGIKAGSVIVRIQKQHAGQISLAEPLLIRFTVHFLPDGIRCYPIWKGLFGILPLYSEQYFQEGNKLLHYGYLFVLNK